MKLQLFASFFLQYILLLYVYLYENYLKKKRIGAWNWAQSGFVMF